MVLNTMNFYNIIRRIQSRVAAILGADASDNNTESVQLIAHLHRLPAD